MALRFRKSIKLAPGIRWNLSGSGSSFSFGPRGASVSVGNRGTNLNSSIAGTGLSWRTKLDSSPSSRSAPQAVGYQRPQQLLEAPAAPTTIVRMTIQVLDDGTLQFLDAAGHPVSPDLVEKAKSQNREAIVGLIQKKCNELNDDVEALGCLHHDTPDPRIPPRFTPTEFTQGPPIAPVPRKLTFWQNVFTDIKPQFLQFIFRARREATRMANLNAAETYLNERRAWQSAKVAHEAAQDLQKRFIEVDIVRDPEAMERQLRERLQSIAWPRETSVAFDIQDGGAKVMLDVDLPEVEDMPRMTASVPSRGLKLSVKEMSATKVQKLYTEHAHGIVFRLVGEVFAALPVAQTVVVSGYTQRPDPATGNERDEYVLSVRVERTKWREMDFARLKEIDVVEGLARYEARSKPQRAGKMGAIEPYPA